MLLVYNLSKDKNENIVNELSWSHDISPDI